MAWKAVARVDRPGDKQTKTNKDKRQTQRTLSTLAIARAAIVFC